MKDRESDGFRMRVWLGMVLEGKNTKSFYRSVRAFCSWSYLPPLGQGADWMHEGAVHALNATVPPYLRRELYGYGLCSLIAVRLNRQSWAAVELID